MYFSKQDSEYVESLVRGGTSLEQAMAQMEVMRDGANFKRELVEALSDPEVLKKLSSIVGDVTRKEPYD